MTNIPVLEQWRNVGKKSGCQFFTADVMHTSFIIKSFQSDNHVYCDLNKKDFRLVYLGLSTSFLNCAGRYSTITL